jgi:hypothetical protein
MVGRNLIHLAIFFFLYLSGPEKVLSVLSHFLFQLWQGKLPGQINDLSKLSDLAQIASFVLTICLLCKPSHPPTRRFPRQNGLVGRHMRGRETRRRL